MNCGLEPSLVCLDFEFTGALHLYMFPKKREKLWKIDLKNGSSLDKVLTKKKRKLIIVRDVSLTKKTAFKKAKEVQPVLRRSLRLKQKNTPRRKKKKRKFQR
jgi:hypothetical protein